MHMSVTPHTSACCCGCAFCALQASLAFARRLFPCAYLCRTADIMYAHAGAAHTQQGQCLHADADLVQPQPQDQHRAEAQALHSKVLELQLQVKHWSGKAQRSDADAAAAKQHLEARSVSLQDALSNAQALESNNYDLHKQAKTRKALAATQERRLTSAEREAAKLRAELSQQSRNAAKAQQALQAENMQLKQQLAERTAESEASIKALQDAVDDLQTQLKDAKEDLREWDDNYAMLRSENEALQRRVCLLDEQGWHSCKGQGDAKRTRLDEHALGQRAC